jgi:hypothetical protein
VPAYELLDGAMLLLQHLLISIFASFKMDRFSPKHYGPTFVGWHGL